MKVRLTINENGELVRRDGTVIGRVESMTFNLEVGEGGTIGGVGTPSGNFPQGQSEESQDGGTGETKLFDAPSIEDQQVDDVWTHYQQTISSGSRYELNRLRTRIIKRALKVRTADECKRAITGLTFSQHHLDGHYLDIKYALGKPSESPDEVIDRMAAKVSQGAGTSANPSARSGNISAYDQRVLSDSALAIFDSLKHPEDTSREYDASVAVKRLAERYGLGVAMDGGQVTDLKIAEGGRASSEPAIVTVARRVFRLNLEGPAGRS